MPRDDIKYYCMTQQGRLVLSIPFKGSIAGLYYNPTEVYFKTFTFNLSKEVTANTLIPGIDIDKQRVTSNSALASSYNNSVISLTYQDAMKAGAFGCFDCISNKTSKSMWSIVIRPIAFEPENPLNKLETNVLYLLISPNDNIRSKLID